MKVTKNFIQWLVNAVISIISIPAALIIFFFTYFLIPVGGQRNLILWLYYAFNNWLDSTFTVHEMGAILVFLAFFLVLLGIAIVCGLPGLILLYILMKIAVKLYTSSMVRRKNAWCRMCYVMEESSNKDHKPRMDGDEWLRKREREGEESRARYEKEKEQKKAAKKRQRDQELHDIFDEFDIDEEELFKRDRQKFQQEKEQFYRQQQEYQYQQQQQYQYQQQQSQSTSSELQKAMAVFMYDTLDFTEADLKRTRNRLIKSFHPDGSDDESADQIHAQKINNYYSILKPYAKK